MRNITQVLNQIITIALNHNQSDLVVDLQQVIKDVNYTAPEMVYMRWNQAHNDICYRLLNSGGLIADNEDTEWKLEILSIFSTKTVEELKEIVVDR